MSDSEQFKREFGRLLQRVGDKVDTVVRKAAIDIGTSLVMKSPVDTGRFRGNWQFGIGKVNQDVSSEVDKSGAASVGRVVAGVGQWGNYQTMFMTNSLPYAIRLEYGWSQQSPQGMVRITVVEFKAAIRKALKDSK